MYPVKIMENIHWVGAIDWNIRYFHGFTYSTHRGTTYNAYLIVDNKTTLIDTVHKSFADEMIQRIGKIVDPSKIDYIVANHVESDHSGSLIELLKLAPQAKIIGTAKCKEGLQKHYFNDWDFQIVHSGDQLDLGKRKITFFEAPMLHWPDSMFSYIEKDGLLLPNDGFGQHLASSKRFDDEVDESILMQEAAKYYANILWPYSRLVTRKIEEIQKLNLKINMIAPSHGVIWRSNPPRIIEAYLRWASGEAANKVLIVYDTMWGSTEKMAKAIATGLIQQGVKTSLFRLPFSDIGDVIGELLQAKGLLIGSSTINNGVLPTMAPFLEEIQGLRPQNKIAAVFGSYGWGGGAAKTIEETLKKARIDIVQPALTVQWVPDSNETQACIDFGSSIAKEIKKK
jgi:flavorubredoxin